MEKKTIKEIMKVCKMNKRKVEELLKFSLFCGDTYEEAKINICKFYLSKTCPKKQKNASYFRNIQKKRNEKKLDLQADLV